MASKKARLSESLIEFRKAEESLKCYSISKKYMIEKKKQKKEWILTFHKNYIWLIKRT